MELIEQLEASGLSYSVVGGAAAFAIRQRWREVFAKPLFVATGQWIHQNFEWHTFSYEYTPALAGARALDAYARQAPCTVWLFDGEPAHGGRSDRDVAVRAIFDRAPLPNLEQPGSDLMVVDVDFTWTMAFTHEDGWYGPYFTTATEAAAAADRLAISP